jgi:hypothetical protein
LTDSGWATATYTPDRNSRHGPSAAVGPDSAADRGEFITLDWHSVCASAKRRFS